MNIFFSSKLLLKNKQTDKITKLKIKMSRNVQCPLHGFITLTPLMCKIVDTPEFKRLHNLRQTGAVYCVYPSANHTRFEHSIGVAHLAKILIKSLQTNQPELNLINSKPYF